MGTLDVRVNGMSVWSLSGDQGNDWNIAQIPLSAFIGTDITVTFIGVYGGSWSGDMAIDNIYVDECGPLGCTDPIACNYDPSHTIEDGSCVGLSGCMIYTMACNYDPAVTCDDGSCILPDGCTNATACNYNPNATCDDGSCIFPDGCTDPLACNYDPLALCDDGSCILPNGCTDPTACNYDPAATCDDGSCLTVYGCTDPLA